MGFTAKERTFSTSLLLAQSKPQPRVARILIIAGLSLALTAARLIDGIEQTSFLINMHTMLLSYMELVLHILETRHNRL